MTHYWNLFQKHWSCPRLATHLQSMVLLCVARVRFFETDYRLSVMCIFDGQGSINVAPYKTNGFVCAHPCTNLIRNGLKDLVKKCSRCLTGGNMFTAEYTCIYTSFGPLVPGLSAGFDQNLSLISWFISWLFANCLSSLSFSAFWPFKEAFPTFCSKPWNLDPCFAWVFV